MASTRIPDVFAPGCTVIVLPCSKEKRWHEEPHHGALPASRAYISSLHLEAQRLARASGLDWVVLSALHGLLRPYDLVPGDYDVTFSRPADPVIGSVALAEQAQALGISAASRVVSLCPDDYTDRLRAALGTTLVEAPLAGIPLHELAAMTRQIQTFTLR
jgi:hypothetical protein